MTLFNRPRQRGNATHKAALQERRRLFVQFPFGKPVTWHGEDVGFVTGYDELKGRIYTSTNPDGYDPTELDKPEEHPQSASGAM